MAYYSFIMGLTGLMLITNWFFLAIENFKHLYALIAASILEIGIIALAHNDFLQVLNAFSLSLGVYFLWALWLLAEEYKNKDMVLKINNTQQQ